MYDIFFPAPWGPLRLCFENEQLIRLDVNPGEAALPVDQIPIPEYAERIWQWLEAYFSGKCPTVEQLPIKLHGTKFQMTVWNILTAVPYGTAISYGELARRVAQTLGMQKMSAQAIGQAVGANPIGIIIPCHRVLGSKGQLTGYAGGIEKKAWLLKHECIPFKHE